MALVDVIIGYAKGGQGDVGPQGPEGPQGPQGPQGPLPPLVNNALSTTPGVAALDAAMGKTLQDEINTTNSNLTDVSNGLTALSSSLNGYRFILANVNGTTNAAGDITISLGTAFTSAYILTQNPLPTTDMVVFTNAISGQNVTIRVRKATDWSLLQNTPVSFSILLVIK